jgi:MYXO-CTERM domain-containing protein
MCVPQARGVPYLSPKTPNWWAPPDGYEEERWTGATRRAFDGGAEATTWQRAIWDKATTQLYLEFHVGLDPSKDPGEDHVAIAMRTGVPGEQAVFILIDPLVGCTGAGACAAPTGAAIATTDIHYALEGPSGCLPFSNTPPAGWNVDNAYVFVEEITSGPSVVGYDWTVKMRVQVPVDSGTGEVASTFKLYTNPLVTYQVGPSTVTIQSPWPRTCTSGPSCSQLLTNTTSDDQICQGMNDVEWGNLSTGETCTDGIVLERMRVGSDFGEVSGMPGSQIRLSDTEQTEFRAEILNGMTRDIQQDEIKATFFIANWGISPPDGLWNEIGNTTLSGVLAPGEYAIGATPSQGTLKVSWGPTTAQLPDYTAHPHQCVRVQLETTPLPSGSSYADWGNLDFANDSVYRNMNFVTASVVQDKAEISVVGLPGRKGGASEETVHLAVHTRYMPDPERCARAKAAKGTPVPIGCDNGKGKRFMLGGPKPSKPGLHPKAKRKPADAKVGPDDLPMMVVHGYRDTGKKVNLLGKKQVPVLEPFGSYGYYVQHDGDLEGWEPRLDGAKRIAKSSVYELKVPKNHIATVAATIRAIGKDTPRCARDKNAPGCAKPKLPPPRKGKETTPDQGEGKSPEGKKPDGKKPEKKKPERKCGCSTQEASVVSLAWLFMLGFARRRRRAS